MESRREIRKRIRSARRGVSDSQRTEWSKAICNHVSGLEAFRNAEKVAGFLAFDGEADPLELMIEAERQGKRVYVPTIVAKGQPLMFVPWTKECEMVTNEFGILEPVVLRLMWVEASELDFVITPLVAFDELCNRIGVGGGYYDRSFAFLNEVESKLEIRPTRLFGFAFGLQKTEPIKAGSWDVQLDGVATEMGVSLRAAN